ncbi:MAG: hypothetical protein PHY64_06035 [Eubacteriales bacterium]|nr:hypothetical protein [Eubacteriales bacterium]HMM01141.1 hypothetical protein [Bacilli bacterium]
MEHSTTEIVVGKTLFIVTAECSPAATETLEQKLKKLIIQHIPDVRKVNSKLSDNAAGQLAMSSDQSEHGHDPNESRRSSDDEETAG